MFGTRVLRGEHVGLQTATVRWPCPSTTERGRRVEDADLEETEAAPRRLRRPTLPRSKKRRACTGYNVGFEQGHAAGHGCRRSSDGRVGAASDGAGRATSTRTTPSSFAPPSAQVVDLALQIAQKVVEREVENMPDLAINVIRAALEEMDARTAVRVRVSPDDEELLRRRWAQVVPSGIGADRIELLQDERVQSGGAIIETTHGQVDAQLETKLAQLGNALWTFVMDVDSARAAGRQRCLI